jgi:uncharacterized membrane protein
MEPEQKELKAARVVTSRAIWRLNVLEYFILLAAVGLALLGGALVAWTLSTLAGLSFRWCWAGSSLLLFIVPGGIVYLREFRNQKSLKTRDSKEQNKDPHG